MEPYKSEAAQTHTVLMSGVGTTKRRKSEATTAIYLNVNKNIFIRFDWLSRYYDYRFLYTGLGIREHHFTF